MPLESRKVFELQDRVHVLKTNKLVWKELKPFPFKKKIGNVVYNRHGKFFCSIIEGNKELPQLFVYDVRATFPQFNKYWEHHAEQKRSMQKIRGRDIKVHEAFLEDRPKRDMMHLRTSANAIFEGREALN